MVSKPLTRRHWLCCFLLRFILSRAVRLSGTIFWTNLLKWAARKKTFFAHCRVAMLRARCISWTSPAAFPHCRSLPGIPWYFMKLVVCYDLRRWFRRWRLILLEKKEKLLTDRAVLSSCASFRMKKEENSDRTVEQPLYHYEAKSIERRSCLRKVPSGNSGSLSDSKVSQMPNSPFDFSPVSDGDLRTSLFPLHAAVRDEWEAPSSWGHAQEGCYLTTVVCLIYF